MTIASRWGRVCAACAGVAVSAVAFPQVAWGYAVTADTQAMVCRVDPTQKDSEVTQFWERLSEDARLQRLDELDGQDPGLRQAIEDYDAAQRDHGPQPAPEEQAATDAFALQQRIAAAGGLEGLGELTSVTAAEAGVQQDADQDLKTEYTEQEARNAAAALEDDPAGKTADALRATAEDSGLRLDEVKAELFAQRQGDFAATQEDLRHSLVECADELQRARPMPLGQKIAIGVGVVVALAVAVRVVVNTRKPTRHSSKSA